MSDKQRYSLSRAIGSLLFGGTLSGLELEHHMRTVREREADPFLEGIALRGRNTLHIPLSGLRQVTAAGDGASLIGHRVERTLDLLEWSACVRAGANVLTGLSSNVSLARTSKLSEPEWIPEIGMAPVSDPLLGSVPLGPPWRISGQINVSRQLLIQASPGLDQYLISGLSRALSNQLDRAALYGVAAPGSNTPTGILGTANTHRAVIDWLDPQYDNFLEMERLVEIEDVGITNFAYIMHPDSKKILRETDRWGGGQADSTIWESIVNPMSSMIVNDHKVFWGEFGQMTIGIFGDAADVVIDNYTLAGGATVRIIASLYCDVAIRLARAFGVADEAAPPRTERPPRPSSVTIPEPEVKVTSPEPPKPAPVIHSEPSPPPATKGAAETDERAQNKKGFRSPFK